MAEHVEVVIKIPKYYLTHPQDYSCLAECVRRGISLPEVHGRLVDADELIKQLEATANIEWNQQVGSSKGLEDAIDIVENMPTIIQAYNCTKPQQGELENPFNDSRFGG